MGKHEGKSVGLGCCWDYAEGGVWANSGFEMPASLAAHGACGKACFDAVEQCPSVAKRLSLSHSTAWLHRTVLTALASWQCPTLPWARRMASMRLSSSPLSPHSKERVSSLTTNSPKIP